MPWLDQRVTIIDEKLKFFESLSKDMSGELKRGLDKLAAVNESIVLLLNKNDIRMSLLETRDDTHDKNVEELKQLIQKYEQSKSSDFAKMTVDIDKTNQKLLQIDKLIYTCALVITGIVTVSGILASAGWLSPDRFKPNSSPTSSIFEHNTYSKYVL